MPFFFIKCTICCIFHGLGVIRVAVFVEYISSYFAFKWECYTYLSMMTVTIVDSGTSEIQRFEELIMNLVNGNCCLTLLIPLSCHFVEHLSPLSKYVKDMF